MSATTITFDNFSLQDSTYRTENITYRHLAHKTITEKEEPRRGGFDIVNTFYSRKEIRIDGWIMAANKQALRVAIDGLKKALVPDEKDLVIGYGDDIIKHKATVSSMEVNEEHHHITRIPFSIAFLTLPWGTSSNSITDSKTITSSPYNSSINITGSYGPFPVLKWQVSGTPSSAITTIRFENTTSGCFIEVEGLNLNADGKFLEVDVEKMTVKENTTNVDFKGVFPSFLTGSNSYMTTITGSGFTVTQTIVYFPTYL